jgi:hypothetical protein
MVLIHFSGVGEWARKVANKVIIGDVKADLGQPEAFREQTFGHCPAYNVGYAAHRWTQRVLGMSLWWRAYSAGTRSFDHTSPAAVLRRRYRTAEARSIMRKASLFVAIRPVSGLMGWVVYRR